MFIEGESLVNDATGPLALSSEPPWSSTPYADRPPWLCHLLYLSSAGVTPSRELAFCTGRNGSTEIPEAFSISGGPPGELLNVQGDTALQRRREGRISNEALRQIERDLDLSGHPAQFGSGHAQESRGHDQARNKKTFSTGSRR